MANIIANEIHVGQNRLIPEFNSIDPRSISKWDMMSLKQTKKAVWALDYNKTVVDSLNSKTPSNDDGIVNENLNDQVIQLHQSMHILETQYLF